MSSAEITIDHTLGNIRAVTTVRFEGSDDMASALAEKWAAKASGWNEVQEIRGGVLSIDCAVAPWGEI